MYDPSYVHGVLALSIFFSPNKSDAEIIEKTFLISRVKGSWS